MKNKTPRITIEIEALDTLFFRDARPFTMGDETTANGMFPPSPSVFYGALRAAWLAEHPDMIANAGTDADPTAELRITGIAMQRDDTLFFPLPKDLVKKKNPDDPSKDESRKLYTVYPLMRKAKSKYALINNLPAEHILRFQSDDVVEELEGGMISQSLFTRYADGRFSQGDARKLTDWIEDEAKIGMARNSVTHASREGALYRLDMRRPEVLDTRVDEQGHNRSPHFSPTATRFIVQISGLDDFPKQGMMHLGGEGKAAAFHQIDAPLNVTSPSIDAQGFKVCLATPAVFANGWLPGWLEQDRDGVWQGSPGNGMQLTLLAAAVGRYQPIGGFDIIKKLPKPLQRMVPAGSVYYFRLDAGSQKDVVAMLHQTAISDDKHYCRQGFGISYVAKEGA